MKIKWWVIIVCLLTAVLSTLIFHEDIASGADPWLIIVAMLCIILMGIKLLQEPKE